MQFTVAVIVAAVPLTVIQNQLISSPASHGANKQNLSTAISARVIVFFPAHPTEELGR